MTLPIEFWGDEVGSKGPDSELGLSNVGRNKSSEAPSIGLDEKVTP